ncbi:exodeoxyribonuclease VII small subunit [uncultured Campylobacter sp.]|jgi:exonuclease VII small subunit|uniref:exodeoxyribonuclease VII small subunit n=1 Tax=uncultured Campylobacter sp. TaxID=218934 RepID=UPI002629DC9A|nr:exodeoxyribonuclease VII small subunit [uncultured Campylobacter sp.]
MSESFEEKMEKINALLKSLNDKDLSLEESVKLYKQGVALLKEAKEILENAKLEVAEINAPEQA